MDPLSHPLSPSPSSSTSDPSDSDELSCYDLSSLLSLSSRGQWRSVIDLVARARSLNLLSKPHEHLIYLSFNTLALFKLRNFSNSALEIQTLTLADDVTDDATDPDPDPDPFRSPKYRYETYPDTYPNRRGSMIPFSLRILHSLLPHRLNNRPQTLDRLYLLLAFVRRQTPSEIWRRREVFVLGEICCNHFAHKEFDVCFLLLRDILHLEPSDPSLVSKLGYLQLQIGDLNGASATFKKVESFGLKTVEFLNLVGRNRALEHVVAKDYVGAVREYEECVERDPGDVVAMNNKALCLMYLRDLSDSIKLLEGGLERVPTAAVNETVVVNLCSMYELAYVNHGEIKKSLSNWIARVAPDDFDSSCTRI